MLKPLLPPKVYEKAWVDVFRLREPSKLRLSWVSGTSWGLRPAWGVWMLLSRWYILSTTWYSTSYLKGMVGVVAGRMGEEEKKRLIDLI